MENQLPPPLKGKKVSEAFMEYVEPYLAALLRDRAEQGIPEIPSLEEIESILKMPWLIWNALVAETVPSNKIDFLAWMDELVPKHMPDNVKQLLDSLKTRKRNQFSQYQYYLGEYKLYYDKNNEVRIKVEARSPVRS
ncbi:MAG TPA: hypothetical protein VNK03_03340 [Gammaproteobacteria bacterium]|nr:hypothetical protein [Gammaproteobacteria bacterium]